MANKNFKIIVFVPSDSAKQIREAMAQAGAGIMGNYSYASFSVKGTGRFMPLQNANPNIGKINQLEEVEEERIETICPQDKAKEVVEAIKKAHPYEEPVIDIIALENL